ncbi:MAG: hypothetical protein K2G41_10450 [Duncaniella sp.]|uniref:helix-turn-helix domain-containing protein n=1 Tax=Duncaniella sp. TaxID=2518496 RepID=UPI0023BE9076|nr:hypothetical protein [Duncaniella sp.]MDE6091111.1 hypothetical protein [Duncaniella sp.]
MDKRVERIREALEWLKTNGVFRSNREIAEKMGYNPSMLSQVITGKSAVSQRFVKTLCAVAPGLRQDWVWNGNGDMFMPQIVPEPVSGEVPTDFERLTFIMEQMAQLVKSFSIVVGPLDNKLKALEKTVKEQDKKIKQLENELQQMKKAAPSK